MSDRINPMDQGLLGKIGNKVGESGSPGKPDSDSAVRGLQVPRQSIGSDTVELTSGAKLLERLEKTLASIPEVDQTRIAVVKAQIESGEYQIDADNIAATMLRMDQELDSQ
jgi:negative regulator of flagellin synthesis FlgM